MTFLRASLMLLLTLTSLNAHPVPTRQYDRTITISLTEKHLEITCELMVDPQTILLDLPDLLSRKELANLTSNRARIKEYGKQIAPILARQLEAKLDGRPVRLTCFAQDHELVDHLIYEFRFRASWQPTPQKKQMVTFRDTTWLADKGRTRITVLATDEVKVLKLVQPDKTLKTKPLVDFRPGDEAKSRRASVTFRGLTRAEIILRDRKRAQNRPRFPFSR